LGSLNLSKINTKEDIERVIPIACRMLDNVIDLNYYPSKKPLETNLSTRAIGLGVMGESEMLASKKVVWGSEEHLKMIDEIMEMVSYNIILASSNLGEEKGSYSSFESSNWKAGLMPIDLAKPEAKDLVKRELVYNWDELREKTKEHMRNGYLMAIAPTSSISILVGTTQAIEPVYRRKWFEDNLSGLIPVVAPQMSADTWNYYIPAFEMDQLQLVKAAAVRQKWIDQGQSLNIFIRSDKAKAAYLNEIYLTAWKLGLKSTYYLKSESPEQKDGAVDRQFECLSCQ